MHLLTKYSLSCGAKVDRPYIYESAFPLVFKEYIVLQGSSKSSKTYDMWDDVISMIAPALQERGIRILQLGAPGERAFGGAVNLIGMTTINQVAYIVKHAKLVMGVDSFIVHLAGHYDVPIVALYSNNFIENVKPYWGNPEKQALLEPFRKNYKPSFSNNEMPKSINTIGPEVIANHVLNFLEIPQRVQFKSLKFGQDYVVKMLEMVPDHTMNPADFHSNSVIVRMDFHFNEENLVKQLSVCPCIVVTDKPISIDLLKAYKQRVAKVCYYLNEKHDVNFIKELFAAGIEFQLISHFDYDVIDKLKIHYMDYGIITKQPMKEVDKKDNLYYKSAKITLSQGKIYPCRAAWMENKPLPTKECTILPVDFTGDALAEFWKESTHFMFFSQI